jgi:hypothetical protein
MFPQFFFHFSHSRVVDIFCSFRSKKMNFSLYHCIETRGPPAFAFSTKFSPRVCRTTRQSLAC